MMPKLLWLYTVLNLNYVVINATNLLFLPVQSHAYELNYMYVGNTRTIASRLQRVSLIVIPFCLSV